MQEGSPSPPKPARSWWRAMVAPGADGVSLGTAFISGAIAGGVGEVMFHPLDTVRARLQVQRGKVGQGQYRGLVDAVRKIVAAEGVRGLYKGYAIVGVLTIPAHGLYFGGYEMTKRNLTDRPLMEKSFTDSLAAGAVAELSGSFMWTPMDVAKQRLQVQQASVAAGGKYHGSLSALRVVWREEGLRQGLYRGFWASLWTYVPYCSLYFLAYDSQRLWYLRWNGLQHEFQIPFPVSLTLAASAAGFACFCTNPMDVIKTRLQTQVPLADGTMPFRSWMHCLTTTVRSEGLLALGKGLAPRLIWLAPQSAVSMMFYEIFKRMLSRRRSRRAQAAETATLEKGV